MRLMGELVNQVDEALESGDLERGRNLIMGAMEGDLTESEEEEEKKGDSDWESDDDDDDALH
eukprot:CAMPEP_0170461982 /NCGR_PEP_ID=MMETSP0123-20130129/7668_1 /TAXON_ID=182087 /ORGANISM="Favella ehrenbergii, Strain Fehren 1" /LENGTH=61 /DNA_ID=CAMNT_0010727107 /DNA_START=435 /DNA_END=620 /DNA_ORIENTATION=+